MDDLDHRGLTRVMTTHLIIGGTGKTGRRVHARLAARGASVQSLSRPAFDWADPTTWSSVQTGATSVYLTYAPDITFPGAAEAVAAVAGRVLASGARRLVVLTGRGEPEAQRSERLVVDLAEKHDAEWAIVRSAFFMQNFDESLFADAITAGEFAFPADTVREPFVDVDDIADVVTGILLGEVPSGQVFELTGPELITFAEATDTIARATGRHITYFPITVSEYTSDLMDLGLPREDAVGLGELFGYVLDGHNEYLADGVTRALGREARRFADYARLAADNGAWAREPVDARGLAAEPTSGDGRWTS
jgi:uncharacterized protein YbjT (DUF2867 family)